MYFCIFFLCLGEYYENYDNYRNIVLKLKKKKYCCLLYDFLLRLQIFFFVSLIFLYYDVLVMFLEVVLKVEDRFSGVLGIDIFIY